MLRRKEHGDGCPSEAAQVGAWARGGFGHLHWLRDCISCILDFIQDSEFFH